MSDHLSEGEALWRQLVEGHAEFARLSQAFLSEKIERVQILQHALRGKDRNVALLIASSLPETELMALFDELVFLASFSHGAIQRVRDLIVSLPRPWVLARIRGASHPLLENATYDEYRRLLELYRLLDPTLTQELALKALSHSDLDIREAGNDFINIS